MSSTINPNNIDTAYPIAGQDNDSQGFRDNFTNISTNFATAKDEIEELQNKAILKSAITGTTLNNDLAGAEIKNATLVDPRLKVAIYASTADIDIDLSAGNYIRVDAGSNVFAIDVLTTVVNEHHSFFLELSTTTGPATVTLNFIEPGYTITLNTNNLVYLYEAVTTDGGANWKIIPAQVTDANAPTTAVGQAGDRAGDTAVDSDYAYYCVANHDGATSIWRRVAIATW